MFVALAIPKNFGVQNIQELHHSPHLTSINKLKPRSDSSDDLNEVNYNGETKGGDDSEDSYNIDDQPLSQVYQQFLNGENIFDQLMESKRSAEERRNQSIGVWSSSIWSYSEEKASSIDINVARHDATQVVLTSCSLNLARHIGRCLQIMEYLDPDSAKEAFKALEDALYFYLYHIFIWFGVNIPNFFKLNFDRGSKGKNRYQNCGLPKEQQRKKEYFLAAKKKYPTLTRVINDVNDRLISRQLGAELEDLIKEKFNSRVRIPPSFPDHAKCLMEASEALELNSDSTKKGVAARFVATETLTFLVEIVKHIHGRLLNHTPKAMHKQVEAFVETSEKVVDEFKTHMYRNVPTLLISLGTRNDASSIMGHIERVNWASKTLTTEPNAYVKQLLMKFEQIETELSSFATLPKFIHHRLHTEAILWVQELLVYAYSDVRKCSMEGRALMSLDQSVLKKGLQENIATTEPMPDWKYMDGFITAFYLTKQDLIKWCEEHVEYSRKVMLHLIKNGRAQESLNKTQRNELLTAMTNAYVFVFLLLCFIAIVSCE